MDSAAKNSSSQGKGSLSSQPTDAELREALFRSGYLLEYRVERLLEEAGYYTYANRALRDPVTGKAREIDLWADGFAIGDDEDAKTEGVVYPRLVIECVNNSVPVAFFTKMDRTAMTVGLDTLFGTPMHFRVKPQSALLESMARSLHTFSHHAAIEYATQYCTFARKKEKPHDWMATHSEDGHATLDKLMVAAEEAVDDVFDFLRTRGAMKYVRLTLVRPLLVLQGDLWAAIPAESGVRLEPRRHVRYLRRSVVNNRPVAWMVDVLIEDAIPDYLRSIAEDIQSVRRFAVKNSQRVGEALAEDAGRIAAAAEGVRVRDAIRRF